MTAFSNFHIVLRRRLLRALLLLFCIAPTPAVAADWRLTATRSTNYGMSLAFIDVSSIRGGGGRVSFVASTYFSRKTRGMNRVSATISADCATLTYRFDELVSFYNQKPLGRWAIPRPASAMPGTNVYDEVASACGGRLFGNHVENPEAFAATYLYRLPR